MSRRARDRGVSSPAAAPLSREGWRPSPTRVCIGRRDVHVWKASLDRPSTLVEGLAETLSDDERARASRFLFRWDRNRFTVCRGILRAILGRYVRASPGSLVFRYDRHGKPALSAGTLRFNLAHSDGVALYAVAAGREIGIDIEHLRGDFATDEIAGRFFSPREVAALRALAPAARREAFFVCWTRKEAYAKARGEGLSLPLTGFDVSVVPGAPGRPAAAALLSSADDPQETSRWSFRDLPVGPDYAAAVAVEGRNWRLRCWEWP